MSRNTCKHPMGKFCLGVSRRFHERIGQVVVNTPGHKRCKSLLFLFHCNTATIHLQRKRNRKSNFCFFLNQLSGQQRAPENHHGNKLAMWVKGQNPCHYASSTAVIQEIDEICIMGVQRRFLSRCTLLA